MSMVATASKNVSAKTFWFNAGTCCEGTREAKKEEWQGQPSVPGYEKTTSGGYRTDPDGTVLFGPYVSPDTKEVFHTIWGPCLPKWKCEEVLESSGEEATGCVSYASSSHLPITYCNPTWTETETQWCKYSAGLGLGLGNKCVVPEATYGKGRAAGQVCTKDSVCKSKACARYSRYGYTFDDANYQESDSLYCCPTSGWQYAIKGWWQYCTNVPAHKPCFYHSQCLSKTCNGVYPGEENQCKMDGPVDPDLEWTWNRTMEYGPGRGCKCA